MLKTSKQIEEIAGRFYNRTDFLYLGRGINYPIALEGALKLKEISYIHAEGYPAGEMKHGPIALIDEQMPVVAIAPQRSRLREDARQHSGSEGARRIGDRGHDGRRRHHLAAAGWQYRLDHRTSCRARPSLTPIAIGIPLQLLAYHIAVRRGCDVDQPRNLAKSVTVE